MKYLVDKSLGEPAYLQLYEQVKRDIVNGVLSYGDKLPPKRQMAGETQVSIITVEHAYSLLRDEGYVESRERSAYRVSFRSSDGFAPTMGRGPGEAVPKYAKIFKTSGSEPNSSSQAIATSTAEAKARRSSDEILLRFPYSVFAKTARAVLSDAGDGVLEPSPGAGRLELRETLRDYLARKQGIYADVDQIVIGSGAENLYFLIVGMLGSDITVALESPSYEKIRQVYTAHGVTCELLPLGPDGIETEALLSSKADVLHIIPYSSFPTGITAPISKRYEYLNWAERNNSLIVEDDYESEFSVSGKPVESVFALSTSDNVIYLNTFSKSISPALRMGYMVLPRHLVGVYEERLGFLSCSVPTFDQLIVARLISSGDFSRHVNRVRRAKRKQLKGESPSAR
ncbi:MAG: PLP-dependent aminotransferase family protein [Coriobacteriales bacterium]|jgi:GntR family transcriptional regulator/MocR family aminotransferase